MQEETFKVYIRNYKAQTTIETKIKAVRYSDAMQLAESMYGDGGNNITITIILIIGGLIYFHYLCITESVINPTWGEPSGGRVDSNLLYIFFI
jgi:hypothetical protein